VMSLPSASVLQTSKKLDMAAGEVAPELGNFRSDLFVCAG
jgi:hypothetical protein